MKEKTIIKLWAMSLIASLETINLIFFGVDSVVFTTVVAAIAGLAGYEIGKRK